MPPNKEIVISKSIMPSLPEVFEETHLGALDGAIRQYRSSSGMHAREYKDRFVLHQDRFDPRREPVYHLVLDSPETLLALGSAAVLSKRAGKISSSGELKLSGLAMNPFLFMLAFFSLNGVFRSLKRLLLG